MPLDNALNFNSVNPPPPLTTPLVIPYPDNVVALVALSLLYFYIILMVLNTVPFNLPSQYT